MEFPELLGLLEAPEDFAVEELVELVDVLVDLVLGEWSKLLRAGVLVAPACVVLEELFAEELLVEELLEELLAEELLDEELLAEELGEELEGVPEEVLERVLDGSMEVVWVP